MAAAKREGAVVVMGSAHPVVRTELPAAFKARFGIALEYIGGRGSDNFTRLTMEHRAGVETEGAALMRQQVLPVEVISLPDVPGYLTAGNGLLALVAKSPHPNAARLFVNWAASKEGLEVLARARKKPTTRTDVDESFVLPLELPQPGARYFDMYD